jgi:hypothetical protein
MSTLTGKDLNLVKPALTDDHKVTIGTHLPANFQKIDDEFTAHLAENVQDAGGVHGLDIEEGTWTPTLQGLSVAGSHTYSKQTGEYTKVGNLVTASFNITLSSKDANMSGTYLFIGGLPFTSNAPAGVSLRTASFINFGTGNFMTLSLGEDTTHVILFKNISNAGPAFINASEIADNSVISGSLTFRI